jgi:3-deoxy-7-phosphoheptulonate synthase
LSCPVGFKNGTDGTIKIAIDAIGSASAAHHFLSVTKYGHSAIVETTGNEDCHIILRGGKTTNFDADSVKSVTEQLKSSSLNSKIMIDFSHGNSSKKFANQMLVCQDVCQQIAGGNDDIFGVMVESHLVEGRQDLIPGEALTYGQSITDACIGWQDTEKLLAQLDQAVAQRQQN